MRIGFLGSGSWGFCLANLLASKGHEVISWTTKPDLAKELNATGIHPLFSNFKMTNPIFFTTNLDEVLHGAEFIVESVTSAGIRPVFEQIKEIQKLHCPIVMTSKGIEQNSGLILSDVIIEILGEDQRNKVGLLSGPSYAQEVIRSLPTSVVASAYDYDLMMQIVDTFTTKTFRVYPNSDVRGVAFGGALKNIVAIACGISDGLELGYSSKASLMTRGLHEMRKLAIAEGCQGDTLNGLSGLGDLCVTCSSNLSRNFRYGLFLAQGMTPQQAQEKIGMVVEGAYTCFSALQLSKKMEIPMPITEVIYNIIYDGMLPIDAVRSLMQRAIKEEHL